MINWTFDQAEQSFHTVVDTALPAIVLLEGPLSSIDRIVSKGLDIVEQKVPSINLPPEMVIIMIKKYSILHFISFRSIGIQNNMSKMLAKKLYGLF